MRLDKYLAETAQCTRSEAKTMLAKGRVQVNGAVCKKGDTQLKDTDTVAVDGAPLRYQKFVYLMLNKPEGVVSASTDKRDTTVVDLVGDAYPRRELFPAGRLDKTSTGFVLLTDDGTFAHDILAPKRHVSKTYTVVLDTPLTEEMRTGFAAGVTLAGGAYVDEDGWFVPDDNDGSGMLAFMEKDGELTFLNDRHVSVDLDLEPFNAEMQRWAVELGLLAGLKIKDKE